MSSVFKPKTTRPEEILARWHRMLPNEKDTLLISDVGVDGFYEGHFRSEDMVGIIVVLPDPSEKQTGEDEIIRLMNALKTILEMCLGDLSYVEKQKVVLYLANTTYFNKIPKQDLTPMLTALINSRSIKTDTCLDYSGTTTGFGKYYFELPYQGSTLDSEFGCGKYVKVDLNSPIMQTKEAVSFLTRLGYDFSVCRGKTYLLGLTQTPYPGMVLYLMFRNKVSLDQEWWKDPNNVPNVCAVVLASIQREDGSMVLEYICSRPGTTGAVSEMIRNISIDARDTYHLNRLLLIPAGKTLRQVYQRPAYGFQECCADKTHPDDGYMVKYLTATQAAAGKTGLSDTPRTAGGKKKTSTNRSSRSVSRKTKSN